MQKACGHFELALQALFLMSLAHQNTLVLPAVKFIKPGK